MSELEAKTLQEYIKEHYGGHGAKSLFAQEQGTNQQQVSRWQSKGWLVIDGQLYAPRQKLIKEPRR